MYDDSEVIESVKIYKSDVKKVIEDTLPSFKALQRVYNYYFKGKYGSIQSEDKELKKYIRLAWLNKNKSFNKKINNLEDKVKMLEQKMNCLSVGCDVMCDYDGFGKGKVVSLNSDNLMLVKFDNRELNTMCNSKTMNTVHDDVKRKITII